MIESLYKPFQKWSEKGAVWIFSDPHFEDEDLIHAYDDRPNADELVRRINSKVWKYDTIICLGDVGNTSHIPLLKGYKVLITGNHDAGRTLYEKKVYTVDYPCGEYTKSEALSKMKILHPNCNYRIWKGTRTYYRPIEVWTVEANDGLFDEVYTGPLMISPKLLLSHEPIDCEGWAYNIHGHIHARSHKNDECHYNVCADCHDYLPLNLNQFLKSGALSKTPSIHRQTIDEATERCKKRRYRLATSRK